jgi:phosphoglycerol transferase
MFGSSGNFAGRRAFFENHGNYTVWSVEDAINENKMTEEDKVWWGFDDSDLFNYAKEKIENLSKEDKPFNFTLLTANTHFEDGYFEDDVCENKYDDQYSNVIACSSKQIYEFIEWIKEQDFYDNTVIVISGDHLSMDSDFFENIDKNYDRTVYNAFINSAVSTENTKNRLYTTLDMFPTTLASMGAKIEGNRLGLGTNLFSDEKTLLEKYGKEYMDNELSKNSKYYNQNLISNKSKK